jgi:hypothetical protein
LFSWVDSSELPTSSCSQISTNNSFVLEEATCTNVAKYFCEWGNYKT